jgi:ubiquinone/menaquinone biosynthesis C-methylase UbiE
MYKSIRDCLKKNDCFPLRDKILGISGIGNFLPFIDTENSELIEVNYPEADLQRLQYENDYFDVLISDQVLEHIEDPNKAIEESFRVLKNSGIMIHTTCFVNYYHPCPNDYWRFSPEALRFLSKNFSQILSCEGWGNRLAVFLCFIADRFRSLKIPDRKFSLRNRLATYNEKNYPIVTWIIAKK